MLLWKCNHSQKRRITLIFVSIHLYCVFVHPEIKHESIFLMIENRNSGRRVVFENVMQWSQFLALFHRIPPSCSYSIPSRKVFLYMFYIYILYILYILKGSVNKIIINLYFYSPSFAYLVFLQIILFLNQVLNLCFSLYIYIYICHFG